MTHTPCVPSPPQASPAPKFGLVGLVLMGIASWLVYVAICTLATRFEYGRTLTTLSIPLVLLLFGVNFALYLWALRWAIHLRKTSGLQTVIVGFAIAYRTLLIFTPPILEIDIYRYIWDGQVSATGENPFRYSPATVRDGSNRNDVRLQRLVALKESAPGVGVALSRVHFAELTTVYPPFSQVVFALAAYSSPPTADVVTLRLILKSWLLFFDLGTIFVIAWMLAQQKRSPGWLVAYAWCPLVMKEFANSGHLDTIAVFWLTLAVALATRGIFPSGDRQKSFHPAWCLGSMVSLGLGVGAKLFPVLLAPLLTVAIWRRLGIRTAMACGMTFGITSAAVLAPWVVTKLTWEGEAMATSPLVPPPTVPSALNSLSETMELQDTPTHPYTLPPPVPQPVVSPAKRDMVERSTGETSAAPDNPSAGLSAFLSRWKMNDFLFQLIEANVSPDAPEKNAGPWFAIVPNSWRQSLVAEMSRLSARPQHLVPFLLARMGTLGLFFILMVRQTIVAGRAGNGRELVEPLFLTLAWFWLLSPTLNPWYWTWAIPLLPFARARSWWLMSGLIFIYYVRFWLGTHWNAPGVLGTPYNGHQFFDYVVVWLEFAPWLGLLAWEWRRRRIATPSNGRQGS